MKRRGKRKGKRKPKQKPKPKPSPDPLPKEEESDPEFTPSAKRPSPRPPKRKRKPSPRPPKRKKKRKRHDDPNLRLPKKQKRKRGRPSYASQKVLFARAGYASKLNFVVESTLSKETQSREVLVQLSELALLQIGAKVFHVKLPTPPLRDPVPIRSTGATPAVFLHTG